MQERYGLSGRSPARFLLPAVVVLAFVGALTFVTAMLVTRDPVSGQVLTWTVVSPDRVDLTLRISSSGRDDVTCVVRAQDLTMVDVAYVEIDLTPEQQASLVPYSLRTLARAATVSVLGCATGGSPEGIPPPQFPPGVVPPEQPWTDSASG
jgi:hypothetical protein